MWIVPETVNADGWATLLWASLLVLASSVGMIGVGKGEGFRSAVMAGYVILSMSTLGLLVGLGIGLPRQFATEAANQQAAAEAADTNAAALGARLADLYGATANPDTLRTAAADHIQPPDRLGQVALWLPGGASDCDIVFAETGNIATATAVCDGTEPPRL